MEAADDRLLRPPGFVTAAVAPAPEEEQQRTNRTGKYDLQVRGGEDEAN